MNRRPPPLSPDEEEFVADRKSALLNKTTLTANCIIISVSIFFLVLLIWAYFAEINQVTTGNGKVIPSSEDKIVQSLDGGIIDKILVHEGQVVQPGESLLQLNNTRYASDYQNGLEKYLSLAAEVARLTAETQNSDQIVFPADVQQHPDLVRVETNLFNARRQSLAKEVALLQDSLKIAKDEYDMYAKLINKGYVSRLDYDRSLSNMNDIQSRILEKQDQYREQALTELNQHKADLAGVTEQLISLKDKMTRTTLRSPVRGIIKKISITTVGGVINPGMNIMEIVPLSDNLLIQARIQPKDIAFIHVGQHANVKVSAYDYSIYGTLSGVVDYISADAIEENSSQTENKNASAASYYVVRVRTSKNYLGNQSHPLPIMPGMTTVVSISTGKKTVLDYLLKPLLKAREEALRER